MKIAFKRSSGPVSNPTQAPAPPSLPKKPVVNITTVMMGKAKPVAAVEEVKKRGRPSKEDIERKAREKLDLENKIKDELQKKAATIIPGTVVQVNNKVVSVDTPIFKVGDYVKDKVGISRFVYKGIVVRQDVGSRFVCVDWRDGSRQWHSAVSLEQISFKEYKKRERNEPVPEPLSKEEVAIAQAYTEASGSAPSLVDMVEQESVNEEEEIGPV